MSPNFLDRTLTDNMKKNAVERKERVKRETDIKVAVAASLGTETATTVPANLKTNTEESFGKESVIKRETEAEVLRNPKIRSGPDTDDLPFSFYICIMHWKQLCRYQSKEQSAS